MVPLIPKCLAEESYDGDNGSRLVSKAYRLAKDPGDLPPLKFVTQREERSAERVTRSDANSILEEFDMPPLWDDPLM